MARELLDERKTKELRVLESAVLIELNKEKSQRKESEALLRRTLLSHVLLTQSSDGCVSPGQEARND